MPARCTSVGDERKRLSYEVEACFYAGGHAARLLAAGAAVPRPLLVDRGGAGELCPASATQDRRAKLKAEGNSV